MKLKIIIIISLIFNTILTFSQNGWYLQLDNQNLNALTFINENTGFAVGSSGTILKTTNGGVNWIALNSGTTYSLNGICHSADNTYFIVGGVVNTTLNIMLKSTNGGINWLIINSGAAAQLTDITFINSMTGFASGFSETLLKTTDGGSTWIDQMPLSYFHVLDIAVSNTFGIAGGGIMFGGNIWYSSNSGNNWSWGYQSSNTTFYGTAIADNQTAFCTGILSIIAKTTNAGVNWTTTSLGSPYVTYYDITFPSSLTGTTVGAAGLIRRTTNGGANWFQQNSNTSQTLRSVFFINNFTGYAAGGVILKTTDGGGPVGIHPISTEIPNQFSLSQNYPNPFNPSTKIRFALPKNSFAMLVVYDALGRELETLVNEQLTAGTYEADWQADKFSSGVYYYKLTTGDFVETKKMILIK